MPHGHDRRRAGRQVGAVRQVPFAQVRVAVQEHPTVCGNAQAPGRGDRGQQHGGALVDLLPGHDVPGIGVGDGPVRLGRGDQFGRAALYRRRGVRVGRGDLGERREQRAHRGRVLLAGLLEAGPPGVVDQRVLARGAGEPVRGQVPGHHAGRPYPRSSRLPSACSVKSGLGRYGSKCSMVEMASDPTSSVTWLPPPAITAANSLTRCCGAWPPEGLQDGAGRVRGDPAGH